MYFFLYYMKIQVETRENVQKSCWIIIHWLIHWCKIYVQKVPSFDLQNLMVPLTNEERSRRDSADERVAESHGPASHQRLPSRVSAAGCRSLCLCPGAQPREPWRAMPHGQGENYFESSSHEIYFILVFLKGKGMKNI